MAQTKLENLVNPEVMADMINGKLPKLIKFSPIARIDDTLVGVPGNTITVPKYAYIGDAEDVAEGVAMGTTVLTASTTTATVKKAGKAVEITDEAVLAGYGDPVGEATTQIAKSIASKVDVDCAAALATGSLVYDGSTAVIGYEGIVKAVDLFESEEDNVAMIMFVSPKQVTQLRLDPDFKDINKYPLQTVMTGVIGSIAGVQIVPSKRIVAEASVYKCPIVIASTSEDEDVKEAALAIYLKRDTMVEDDRDVLAGTTVIAANKHYTAVLANDSKVVVAKFKEA